MTDLSFEGAMTFQDKDDSMAALASGTQLVVATCPGCGGTVTVPAPGYEAGYGGEGSNSGSGGGSGNTATSLKMEIGDLATSLDYELDSENEKKFNAIKVLYLRKLKAIMSAVDEKDREILKLKVMSKDNRRTQMIQALKNKIQEKELVIDVLKEEFVKNKIYTSEEVNEAIIKKTVGGPKRFRPLTREELENKVIDLERQTLRKTSMASLNSVAESKHSGEGLNRINIGSNAAPSSARRSSSGSLNRPHTSSQGNKTHAESKDQDAKGVYPEEAKQQRQQQVKGSLATMQNEIIEFGNLVEELTRLRALDVANKATIEKQRSEITDLRGRNAQLAVQEDSEDFLNRELQEYKIFKDETTVEIESLTRQLGVCMEENMQLRAEIDVSFSDHRDELEISKEQCQRLLKQNGALLEQLADLESEMEARFGGFSGITGALQKESNRNFDKDRSPSSQVKALTSQLSSAEARIAELNSELKPMKDTLREKNVTIKDLNKALEAERKKVADLLAKASSSAGGGGGVASASRSIGRGEEGKS